jgi:HEPN domain-containing protein
MIEEQYQILKTKAWEHKRIAEFAIADELYDQGILNYNFALEMLMKSVLVKEGINVPKTHDLGILSNCKNSAGVKILLNSINSTRYVKPLWNRIYNVWNPEMRYRRLGFTTQDFIEICDSYERVYKWIEDQFF